MKYQGEELVRVQSQGELRPGMYLLRKACLCCGKDRHWELLVRELPGGYCSGPGEHVNWQALGDCARDHGCYCGAIARGKVFRLRDEAPAEQQTTATKRRERV